MAWITDRNREDYIKLMAHHFRDTITEDELRKEVEEDPTKLEDFVDWLEDDGKVLVYE